MFTRKTVFLLPGKVFSKNGASVGVKSWFTRPFHLHRLPDSYRRFRDACATFAAKQIRPNAARIDKEGRYPPAQMSKLGEMGLMGLLVPSDFGGAGLTMLHTALAVEELSNACASTGSLVSIHNILFGNFLACHGNNEQKEKFLKPYTTSGMPGSFALSETNAGSDVSNISTTVTQNGEYFILNGEKSWVTSALEAEISIVFATMDKEKKHKGISAFIVPLNVSGVCKGRAEKKMGIRATSTCSLRLENVQIPVENIVGGLGNGFRLAMEQLNKARIGIASQAVGIAQASLDTALDYATNRKAFGQPLIELQAVQLRLAKMAARIEAARLLVWQSASLCDAGENFVKQSSIAKLIAGETATFAAHECVQILGGMGYVEDMPAERYYRDARITEIYGGVSDIQMIIIADQLMKSCQYKK